METIIQTLANLAIGYCILFGIVAAVLIWSFIKIARFIFHGFKRQRFIREHRGGIVSGHFKVNTGEMVLTQKDIERIKQTLMKPTEEDYEETLNQTF